MSLRLLLDYASLATSVVEQAGSEHGPTILCRSALRHAIALSELESGTGDETRFPAALRQLVWELNSGPFISLVERATGLEWLLPDPHLRGGGVLWPGAEPLRAGPPPHGSDNDVEPVASVCVQIGGTALTLRGEVSDLMLEAGDCAILRAGEWSFSVGDAMRERAALLLTHYYRIGG